MTRSFGRPLVCVVTGGTAEAEAADLVDLAERAGAAGVDFFQIRERRVTDAALLSLARESVGRVRGSATAVLVNDRLDVAAAAGADGVHLRSDSAPGRRAREIAPVGFLLGRSVHSTAEAVAAEKDGGLDYLIFGTVFPSASKPDGHLVAGLQELERVCRAVRLPVLAIGGISVERVREVAAAGAAGVAGIGLFAQAPGGLESVVDAVRRAFDTR